MTLNAVMKRTGALPCRVLLLHSTIHLISDSTVCISDLVPELLLADALGLALIQLLAQDGGTALLLLAALHITRLVRQEGSNKVWGTWHKT